MALVHHHPVHMSRGQENLCAVKFCLTWLGFFALIGGLTWVLSSL